MVTDVTSPLGANVTLAVPGPPMPSFSLQDAAITPHLLAAALAAFASNFEDAVAVGAAVGTGVGAPGVDPGFCALATCAGAVGAALGPGSG